MERDCESELSKLNIEQNACIYHFGASVIHGQRSNILRLRNNSMDISYSAFFLSKQHCRYKFVFYMVLLETLCSSLWRNLYL